MVTQEHGEFAYIGDGQVERGIITLSNDEEHHLLRVRRARTGEEIMATDGRGMVYKTVLNGNGELEILEQRPEFGEPQIHMTLLCGNLQGNTSRDVVSSAVQMGVRELWWVNMARSQESYSENKLEKLERVAIQATKQAGRAHLLKIKTAESLSHSLEALHPCTCWVAHPELVTEKASYSVSVRNAHCLVIGPEGGFSEQELLQLKENSNVFRLGNRRLRSETAAVAGLAFVLGQMEAL
jgi:16S rRNA (uracil1498-N3)-methyltransferase